MRIEADRRCRLQAGHPLFVQIARAGYAISQIDIPSIRNLKGQEP